MGSSSDAVNVRPAPFPSCCFSCVCVCVCVCGVVVCFPCPGQNPGLPMQKLQDIQRAMELLSCQGPAKSIDEAAKHKYQFWDTQPVPKLSMDMLPAWFPFPPV